MTVARVIKPGSNPSTGDDFLDDEASAEDSLPVELYEITYGTTIHRLTSGTRDVTYNEHIWTAIPMARSAQEVAGVGRADTEMSITLPIDHAAVRRYLRLGLPPQIVTVTVLRMQTRSGEVRQLWTGVVESMTCNDEGTEATFKIPSRLGAKLLRVIPPAEGRLCRYTLYGDLCGVSRSGSVDGTAFKVSTTVLYVNGRDVRVDLEDTARNGTWAVLGELLHVASGERMTIRDQADLNPGVSSVASLSLQAPIADLKVGDAVEIYRGCDRTIATCHAGFDNRQNFGGMNRMPRRTTIAQIGGTIYLGEL